jgi:hypothetical protein
MLAIPVLAGAGSAAMAGLIGKGAGFPNSLREAPVFYGLCAIGTIGGMALSLASVNPIKLLVLVAVINGVTAGPFLIVVMRVSSDRAIMGESINGAARPLARLGDHGTHAARRSGPVCDWRRVDNPVAAQTPPACELAATMSDGTQPAGALLTPGLGAGSNMFVRASKCGTLVVSTRTARCGSGLRVLPPHQIGNAPSA